MELNSACDLSKECVVLAASAVLTRMDLRSSLPYDNLSSLDKLSTKSLDAKALCVRIASVAGRSATFLMCHLSSSLAYNRIDCDSRICLSVSLGPSITLSSAELVDLDLLASELWTDSGSYFCTLNIRSAELCVLTIHNSQNLLDFIGRTFFHAEFIDNQRVEGNIFVLLNEAMNFFRKHLNMHGKIVGLVRDEYLEVPAEALREAVLNALCHRQYERYNLTIGIAIYDDRIEIENPGILPPQITPENILQPHISYPYNPLIANVLYSTTYIENWGSGVKRIMEACQKRGVAAPIWSINGGFVVVTFMRPAKGDIQGVPQGVPQDVPQGVPQDKELDDWIEKQIRNNPQISTEDLAKLSNRSSKTIKRHLAKMPHIRYVGSGYSGHWEVLDKE